MKYLIRKTSNVYPESDELPCKNARLIKKLEGSYFYSIEINSLEELHKLIKEVNNDIIIGEMAGWEAKDFPECDGTIFIYDDKVE